MHYIVICYITCIARTCSRDSPCYKHQVRLHFAWHLEASSSLPQSRNQILFHEHSGSQSWQFAGTSQNPITCKVSITAGSTVRRYGLLAMKCMLPLRQRQQQTVSSRDKAVQRLQLARQAALSSGWPTPRSWPGALMALKMSPPSFQVQP